jgi:hypothetical protein
MIEVLARCRVTAFIRSAAPISCGARADEMAGTSRSALMSMCESVRTSRCGASAGIT